MWGKQESLEDLQSNVLYEYEQLQVKVDLNPIGGYRGKVGTLTISRKDHEIFTRWEDQDLQSLANITQTILKIQENANVHNTLIFAREDRDGNFKLSFVPYPKCNWIEKIQGLVHVIFGGPSLKRKQVEEITNFYQAAFNSFDNQSIIESKGEHRQGQPDAFCRSEVIEKQRVKQLSFGDNNTYDVLYDNRPRGVTAKDPHLLIVPQSDNGHCDGSQVSKEKRFHMLKIIE
jgi:hypothetical protein